MVGGMQDDRPFKTLESPDRTRRVLIVQRDDGIWSFRHQWRAGVRTVDPNSPIGTEGGRRRMGTAGP
jgi:hypothetical protein